MDDAKASQTVADQHAAPERRKQHGELSFQYGRIINDPRSLR
jgi:hypothetical protein